MAALRPVPYMCPSSSGSSSGSSETPGIVDGIPIGPGVDAPVAAGAAYDGECDRDSPGFVGVSVRAIDEKSILLRTISRAPVALKKLWGSYV